MEGPTPRWWQGLLSHLPRMSTSGESGSVCAPQSVSPETFGRHWRQEVLAVTKPLPWMSLLCCVNSAGEHLQEQEKPSLEVPPLGAGGGRVGKGRAGLFASIWEVGAQWCCPMIVGMGDPEGLWSRRSGAGLIL